MKNSKPPQHEILESAERARLMNLLYDRYVITGASQHRFTYLRKKYAWILLVSGVKTLKRLLDIVVASSALILLSPLLLTIAILIKTTDGGPIFYITPRIGKWGKPFPFPKFRSMQVNADKSKKQLMKFNQHINPKTFKIKKDPRVTWIGKLIRKTSLDELPQLWTVLIGDMTLVGPRPPLPHEVALYTLEDRRRLEVKPGLTCIWQVSGRSEIPFSQQVSLDVQYIESQSLYFDLVLLLKTIPAILLGKGAY